MTPEKKNNQDKLGDFMLNLWFTTVLTVLPYNIARVIYYRCTADEVVSINQSTYYAFDYDKDGKYDRIRELFLLAGARAAAPGMKTYHRWDKEFSELEKKIKNYKTKDKLNQQPTILKEQRHKDQSHNRHQLYQYVQARS
ncbi:hypothetical protein KY330_00105 [Candidatus Woesearchaeota archaeon]|nr:hypothetical protein [Candidatus Woesearchaeota archaeon]